MSEVSADAQRLRRAVVECLDPGPAVVGCSGGPDSLALVASAVWAVEPRGERLHVVVVDHGLQEGSAQVAQAAADAASALGCDSVEVRRVEVGTAGGPEAAAREARREALMSAARERGSNQILLAHTREDQAETVLMRLARGSGARSLSAMRLCDPPWHRPFLDVPRDVVHRVAWEYLEPRGLMAWDDPHNHDPSFTRVRVRRSLRTLESDLGPGLVPGLVRSAELLGGDADALDSWAQGVFQRAVTIDDSRCEADVASLAEVPRAVRTRVIRLMHRSISKNDDVLDFEHVQQVEAMVSGWKGQGDASLPGSVTAGIEYGRLLLVAEPRES